MAGQINWSSSSIGYAFSMEAQDEKREKVQNDDNEKTAIENTNENTQDGEYTFWNYLWDAGYYIPVWGDCQSASDDVMRGNYIEAALHFGMGITIAYGITKSLLQNIGSLFFKSASSNMVFLPRNSLTPTHFIQHSKSKMKSLVQNIKANGIKEPIKYVEYKGSKYIVDGHHRYFAAQKLGIQNVPVKQVKLPYAGYNSIEDLFYNVGKQPRWWKYYQP